MSRQTLPKLTGILVDDEGPFGNRNSVDKTDVDGRFQGSPRGVLVDGSRHHSRVHRPIPTGK